MKYQKLVRDRIPEIIRANGSEPVFHIATPDEMLLALKNKLLEEAAEFVKDHSIEEIADILEVIDAICEVYGYDPAEVKRVQQRKCEERGGFKLCIMLDEA